MHPWKGQPHQRPPWNNHPPVVASRWPSPVLAAPLSSSPLCRRIHTHTRCLSSARGNARQMRNRKIYQVLVMHINWKKNPICTVLEKRAKLSLSQRKSGSLTLVIKSGSFASASYRCGNAKQIVLQRPVDDCGSLPRAGLSGAPRLLCPGSRQAGIGSESPAAALLCSAAYPPSKTLLADSSCTTCTDDSRSLSFNETSRDSLRLSLNGPSLCCRLARDCISRPSALGRPLQ